MHSTWFWSKLSRYWSVCVHKVLLERYSICYKSPEPSEKIGVAAQLQSPKRMQPKIVQACSMTPSVPKDGANATGQCAKFREVLLLGCYYSGNNVASDSYNTMLGVSVNLVGFHFRALLPV